MGFAVLEMTFSPPLPTPTTHDQWLYLNQSVDDCLQSRGIEWLYSLVSVQGDRSICLYQVPYAETLREAYREARKPFHRVWQSHDAAIPQAGSNRLITVLEVEDYPFIRAEHLSDSIYPIILTDGSRTLILVNTALAQTELFTNHAICFNGMWQAMLIQPVLSSVSDRS
jgi:hypothetical protein